MFKLQLKILQFLNIVIINRIYYIDIYQYLYYLCRLFYLRHILVRVRPLSKAQTRVQ